MALELPPSRLGGGQPLGVAEVDERAVQLFRGFSVGDSQHRGVVPPQVDRDQGAGVAGPGAVGLTTRLGQCRIRLAHRLFRHLLGVTNRVVKSQD